jgi:hypothetical protein
MEEKETFRDRKMRKDDFWRKKTKIETEDEEGRFMEKEDKLETRDEKDDFWRKMEERAFRGRG